MADHANVDELIGGRIVREADEDRVGADLSTVRHMAFVELEEYVAEDRALGNHAAQHLVVDQRAHRFLEPPEVVIQARWFELAAHGSDLAIDDSANPKVFGQEAL